MTDLGDRLLLWLVAINGFGTLVVWWGWFVRSEVEGTLAYVFGGMLLVIFLAALLLVWRSFQKMD